MKTFKQFSEQAYESYELVEGPIDYLKGKVKDQYQSLRNTPAALRSAVSAVKKDPVGSLKAGGKSLGKMAVKDYALSPVKTRIKSATGNNPVTNQLIDYAADAATVVPWRSTIKTFGKNLLVRGPQMGLKFAQGLGTLAGVGSRLN
jgi:hypothetical protein